MSLPEIQSVNDLTLALKQVVERSFRSVDVEGEVSRPNQSTSGHIYFTLKDDRAQLPCVIWRSTAQRNTIKLEHGQQIIVHGDIQVYPPHGKYQMIVSTVRQAGVGALQAAFEKLKAKLETEGLFRHDRKKQLPRYPRTIGIVTSATSAAVQDIISTMETRYPLAWLRIFHASVQGANAAPELVEGMKWFSREENQPDIVIIGRGGGSLEDLWPFNEEAVARAIYDCPVPAISAVGHETDFSISDFVADVRAATPTQSVAIAAPDINELRYQVDDLSAALHKTIRERISRKKERVMHIGQTYALQAVRQKIQLQKQKTIQLETRANTALERLISNRKHKLETLHQRLISNDPDRTLKQGYTRIWQDEVWIKRKSDLKPGKPVEIQWKDGRAEANSKS